MSYWMTWKDAIWMHIGGHRQMQSFLGLQWLSKAALKLMKISQSKFKVLKQEKNLLGGKIKEGYGIWKKCGTFEVGISFLFYFGKNLQSSLPWYEQQQKRREKPKQILQSKTIGASNFTRCRNKVHPYLSWCNGPSNSNHFHSWHWSKGYISKKFDFNL